MVVPGDAVTAAVLGANATHLVLEAPSSTQCMATAAPSGYPTKAPPTRIAPHPLTFVASPPTRALCALPSHLRGRATVHYHEDMLLDEAC